MINSGRLGLRDILMDQLLGRERGVDPEFIGPLQRPAIRLHDFLVVRAKLAGKDGDKLVNRLAAISDGVIPNTQAWITRFANK